MGQGENAPEASGPERFDTALKALINAVGLGDASPTAWGLGAVPIADLARTAVETMAGRFEETPAPMTPADAEAILTEVMDR
jgi:hypothetical protein